MIKIIEHGYKKYRTRCSNCHCYFEYELDDIQKGSVECPDCGQHCYHNYSLNVNLMSQIEDEVKVEE